MTRSLRPALRVTCVALMIAVLLQNSQTPCLAQKIETCTTAECRKLGEVYKKNQNAQVKPCNDFYEYVCGGWKNQNPKPKHEDLWGVEQVMEVRAIEQLKKLMDEKISTKKDEIHQARALYKACMNLPFLQVTSADKVKTVMKGVGNWPTFLPGKGETSVPWWKINNQYESIAGESALFNYELLTDLRKKTIFTKLEPTIAPYGMIVHEGPWKSPAEKGHYVEYLKQVVESVAFGNTAPLKKQIDADLQNVVTFRDGLRKINEDMAKVANKFEGRYELWTVKELQDWYNKKATSFSAKIDWLDTIRSIFKNAKDPQGNNVQSSTMVKVQVHYFNQLAAFLGKASNRTIANHIHLYFAERHVEITPKMKMELMQSISVDYPKNGKIRYEPSREETCIEQNNVREGLGMMYIKSHFSNDDKDAVEKLAAKAKTLLSEQISESNWLSTGNKSDLVMKVRYIDYVLGYPKWYKESGRNGEHEPFDIDPVKAAAYFEPSINRLSMSAAYLQPPIYNTKLIPVINYGATVATIGHELYHAFDSIGLMYDLNNEKKWVFGHMYKQFLSQSECFEKQYLDYRHRELLKHKLFPPKLSSTVDEDIADVMGLKLAYKGLKQVLQEKKVCKVLPGFEKDGCDKLFFIAFANTLCWAPTNPLEEQILTTDNHSLPRIRVNGAVANMPEFAAAFQCNKTASVSKTCDIWKK